MSLSRKNNPKASQGGLTPPKLYDSGPDFSESQSQNTEETAIANQLHKCHTSLFAQSQVLHKCLCESVAQMSRCIFVAPSFFVGVECCKYVLPNRCRYVTVANMSVKCGIYVFPESLLKCHCGQNVTSRGKNVTVAQIPQTPSSGK